MGKKSKKRKAIEEIQQEVEDRIADIAQHEEEIAKTEEAIGVKKRAVRRVRRRQIVDEKDYIPNVLSKDRPIVDPDAPGAEGCNSSIVFPNPLPPLVANNFIDFPFHLLFEFYTCHICMWINCR